MLGLVFNQKVNTNLFLSAIQMAIRDSENGILHSRGRSLRIKRGSARC